MGMSNIDKAIEVIAEARRTAPRVRDMQDHVSPHVAQALADAGLLAPDLPEPDREEGGSDVWQTNHTIMFTDISTGAASESDAEIGRVWTEQWGGVGMDVDHSEMYFSPEDARTVALALLAAAD